MIRYDTIRVTWDNLEWLEDRLEEINEFANVRVMKWNTVQSEVE